MGPQKAHILESTQLKQKGTMVHYKDNLGYNVYSWRKKQKQKTNVSPEEEIFLIEEICSPNRAT